ncbi:zinc finger protein 675 isoform X1 [Sergentomyia squamirostris]
MNRQCRVCMDDEKHGDFVDIFLYTITIGNTELYLYDAIQELTNIQIAKNDGKPDAICSTCELRLQYAYELKILAEESDKKFNEAESEKKNLQPEKKTIIERYEYNVGSKDQDDYEISKVAANDEEELDAVSFVLNCLPEQLAVLHRRPEKGKAQKAVEYKDRKHECHVCAKKFLRRSNLIDHLRLHANQRPFKCEHCEKTFVQSGNYKSHLRTHSKERPYACKICHKSYNQPSALKVHIRTHTMEKNYVCSVCEKRFTNSSDLSKHKRIHDETKKYTCKYCSKDFAQNVNLKKHIRNNHKEIPVETSEKSPTAAQIQKKSGIIYVDEKTP